MKDVGIRTGEVAARAGVNIQTIRYYERRGILKEPPRRASGYREYPADAVRLIRFVKRAQDLGFTLDEIEELLQLRNAQGLRCADVRTRAETKIDDIEKKLRDLRAMKRALGMLVASCGDGTTRICPILEALDDDTQSPPKNAPVAKRKGSVSRRSPSRGVGA